MILKALLRPFNWFALAILTVFRTVRKIIVKIISFIGLALKTIYKIIKTIVVNIALILKKIGQFIAKQLILLFNLIKKFFLWLFSIIKKIFISIFSIIKKLVILIAKGIKWVATTIAKSIQVILLSFFRGLGFILSWLFKIIGFFFKYLFLAIKYFFKYTFLAIKAFFTYLFAGIRFIVGHISVVVNFIMKYVKILATYFYKGLKFLAIHLYKVVSFFVAALIDGFITIFGFLAKIPRWIGWCFKQIGKGLYTIFVYPFVYLYKNFQDIINKALNSVSNAFGTVKKAIVDFFKLVATVPGKIKHRAMEWYGNLSVVKDYRNRREMKRQTLLIDFESSDAVRSEIKIPYRYTAKNPNTGKVEKGKLGAYSKLDVHSYLLSEGYEVYEIEVFKGINWQFGGHYKVKLSELVFFLTQLSTYIKSGLPLVDSIKILSRQGKDKKKNNLYKSIIYELTMGDNFSEALDKQGNSFPKLLINMIKSAELTGNLSETLDDMADYYSAVSKTRKQMISAMTYPAVIMVFAMGIITFIMIFVIPEFISIYKGMESEIPLLTRTIITISDFLQANILYLLVGIAMLIGGFIFIFKNVKIVRVFVQWMLMHIPVVSKIMIYNEVTMFSKTFGSLLNHNVFITDSMEILSKITNNEIYKMLIFDTMTNLAKGEPISKSFKNHWAFPMVAYEMLLTGERTGQPGNMMNKVAEYYQEEHKNAINQIKTFIEPVMIVFLAVVVGIILLSVILPMFNMYGAMGLE